MTARIILLALLAGLALTAPATVVALAPADTAAGDDCASAGGVTFICGIKRPEDLVPLPGGDWIVTSGMGSGSGLHLVNIQTKSWELWAAPPATAASQTYRDCPAPLIPEQLQAHGLSLRDRGQGHETLYVVNHGGRETIEVFAIDSRTAKPTLSWLGCVPMPVGLDANSVTSTSEGALFVTVVLHPGMNLGDLLAGRPTGAVYQWRPGDSGFERVWGTEMSGDNGIDLSPDGKTMYVVGNNAVTAFTNTDPVKKLRTARIPGFSPDNVHWIDGRLITAGMKLDDAACGGPIKYVNGKVDVSCPRGYFVAAIDPASMAVKVLAIRPAIPGYNVSAALPIGKTVWLGSFVSNKLAYFTLP